MAKIDWNKKAQVLVGRKIVSASYMTHKEAESLGWDYLPLVLTLDNGVTIYPSADDEGNNGGAFHASDEDYSFPVLI